MDPGSLHWSVEDACLNAWPCPRHVLVHGYLLRAAGGPSKRLNSVNPLRGSGDPEAAIPACEAVFADLGQRPIFRVPSIAARMAPGLDRRGYRPIGETRTLYRDLAGLPDTDGPDTTLAAMPGDEWLALRNAASGHDPDAARTFRAVTGALALPRTFAAVTVEGAIGAIGYAVRDGRLLVIESVAVREGLRNRGLAHALVHRLLRWGATGGATGACLQVETANAPATALYARLGFSRELYRYEYRVRD